MHAVTRAAEGFDRRAFTVSEVLRMQEAGILSEDERYRADRRRDCARCRPRDRFTSR